MPYSYYDKVVTVLGGIMGRRKLNREKFTCRVASDTPYLLAQKALEMGLRWGAGANHGAFLDLIAHSEIQQIGDQKIILLNPVDK